ncbi:AAA family ATPase [Pseudoclavibacter chungangensis]|uniref:AAA family ATPase n=1 Tax=Pseudoclavibacter chungangensis TaxID=587635 RepID=A0A7J5BM24_9MICO|nr:AAA family ATPase [Pseudoclavibacter chungangensis]NYJ65981.1 adenylate kinase family enzyme [Pseudoclavibacter chungangensis]
MAGVSGVGKSTLAKRIGAELGLLYTEIDGLFHGPGWTPRERFLDDVRELVARAAWVTEWQYSSARPLLAERADLLVWLDLPFWTVTLPRLVRRTVRRSARREVLWNENREPSLWSIVSNRDHIIRWGIATRGKPAALVADLRHSSPRPVIVRLRSLREVDAWVDGAVARVAGHD